QRDELARRHVERQVAQHLRPAVMGADAREGQGNGHLVRNVRPSVASTTAITPTVTSISRTETAAMVGSKNCSICAKSWIGRVEMPGPVRNSDTDTSFSEVMKARMNAA